MTVKHLQAVQRQQLALAVAHDPAVLTKFRGGFAECAQEVTRYVSRIEGVDGGVRQRLLQHLGQCVSGLSAMTPFSFTAMAGLPLPLAHLQSGTMSPAPPPPLQQGPGDVNNNQARLLHGLVAARLAAAGDTTGAALLLHGGLSLLARSAPHAPSQPNTQPQTPSTQGELTAPISQQGIQPPSILQSSITKINEGASSSGERPLRPSAFTAVKRASSPLRAPLASRVRPQESLSAAQPQPIIAPTARRPITVPEPSQKTIISAQVAVQPVNLTLPTAGTLESDIRAPLDFSFKKTQLERPTPTHPSISIPTLKHPKPLQSQPVHMAEREISVKHPTPTHPHVSHATLSHTTSTHNTLTHPIPTPTHTIATPTTFHSSLPPPISHPIPTIARQGTYDPKDTQTSHSSSQKRPLEEAERLEPPSKLLRKDQPTVKLTDSSPINIPIRCPVPSAQQVLGSSSQQHAQPGPSPRKLSSSPPPPIHSSSTSPVSPTTPKREMTSEDNHSSPDRPSTSTQQDEKDMWRPW
ncbi:hypothetical protein SK128_022822 [Halocaridina rubra]|uniref:Orange domain-containing protein n=1 Tax=Halocaridina rubra TaxID=373956 RepID=A0AAN9A1E5_HALRR